MKRVRMTTAGYMAINPVMSSNLDLTIQVPCQAWNGAISGVEAVCRRAAQAAFDAASANAGLPGCPIEASVVLADDSMIRSLNRQYRDRDEATNVLSFASHEMLPGDVFSLGDIIVSYQTALAESQETGKGIDDHLCHLVVHGMLHLLGHDHMNDVDAGRMEPLEIAVLSGLGVANPFADDIGL